MAPLCVYAYMYTVSTCSHYMYTFLEFIHIYCIVLYSVMVDYSLLYSIIVSMYRPSSNITLNPEERVFWNCNERYSVQFTKGSLATYSGLARYGMTTRGIFEWVYREVGIQPGEFLIKRHNHSYKYNPTIEMRFTAEAFAYWRLQGFPVDKSEF